MSDTPLQVVSFKVTGGPAAGDPFAAPPALAHFTVWSLLSDGSVWSRQEGGEWIDWGRPPPVET